MTLVLRGTTKLMEECGELVQIIAKKQAFWNTDEHPDGKGSLKERLENEIADVTAACHAVIKNMNLDSSRINERVAYKFGMFMKWSVDD